MDTVEVEAGDRWRGDTVEVEMGEHSKSGGNKQLVYEYSRVVSGYRGVKGEIVK